ncbi:peptidylprolyl isomerase [Algibacter sp. R77976]|uniref:peptidylprolyl isomerase n=1 Tax=Algibacter sp. R77976 TaxID=3093873 RepID=UPI0037C953EB
MFKKLLILLAFSTSSFLIAQTSTEKELEILETPEQAESYLETKKSKKNKLITFNEEKHKTILAKELFKLRIGGTKINEREFEKTYYKVISKTKKTYHRIAYIYIDGSKNSLNEINEFRDKIIAKYNNGAPFDFLAKQYSKDDNANKGGDLGWFLKEDMHPDFQNEIFKTDHSLNDIFTVDVPSENWYYVVLKTHEPKDISEIEVLKIVETKN